jgi:glycosyltransferase involved in cell wall biosynthesis
MKIAIVSRGDRFAGGASRGAEELASWLIEAGHSVTHFCREFQGTPAPFQKQLYAGAGGRTAHYLNAISKRCGYINAFPFEYYLKLRRVQDEFDLFHFHDLSTAVSYETLIQVSRHKPTVFTVHDCSAFTGGCIYPMDCAKYETKCGSCPQIGQWPLSTKFDRTGFMQEQRRSTAGKAGIQYIFPSEWIQQTMMSVMSPARPGLQINNAIDPVQMAPTDKKEARRKLGLPENQPVILISAQDLKDERKGVAYAVEAVRQIADLSPVLISTGHSSQSLAFQTGDIPHTSFGHIREPDRLALIYSAADVYLFPSLADNCPYSLLETMACGTAVIGFATGGVPSIVLSGETGLLVPIGNRDKLATALRSALLDPLQTQRWGEQARRRIESYFSKDAFVKKICNLYENFDKEWRPST